MPDRDFHDSVNHWLAREPGTIILQPTSLCPLACTYCYKDGQFFKN